jgi:predicted DNA-binding transcriptional regulator YafY
VLPARLRSRLEDISEATTSTLEASRTLVYHAALAVVAAIIRKRERLRFGYVDNEGKATRRHVEPVRLVHTGRRWYLVAFDLDRDDWRTFRLDRVSAPEATGMRATRRQGPDPVDLVQRGITVDAWRYRASVLLDVPGAEAERQIPPTVGTVESIDDMTSRLLIGADEMSWLARYLLGLPFNFTVESPPELRTELAGIGTALTNRYGA